MKKITLTRLNGRKITLNRRDIIYYGTSVVKHLGPESCFRGTLGVVCHSGKDKVERIWVKESEDQMDQNYNYPWKR